MVRIGCKYNRLLVFEFVGSDHRRNKKWNCKCDCGGRTVVSSTDLIRGHTKSCGCLRDETTGNRRRTHGLSKTPEYSTWCEIIRRTENKSARCFRDYGGRGIKMSKRWRRNFLVFLKDMGIRPSVKHSIERIENNGDYTKNNCRWAELSEQSRNKRNNVLIEHNGRVMILQDWATELGVTRSVFKTILKKNPKYKIL